MVVAVWEGRGSVMEEGGSFKIWGRLRGMDLKAGEGSVEEQSQSQHNQHSSKDSTQDSTRTVSFIT